MTWADLVVLKMSLVQYVSYMGSVPRMDNVLHGQYVSYIDSVCLTWAVCVSHGQFVSYMGSVCLLCTACVSHGQCVSHTGSVCLT